MDSNGFKWIQMDSYSNTSGSFCWARKRRFLGGKQINMHYALHNMQPLLGLIVKVLDQVTLKADLVKLKLVVRRNYLLPSWNPCFARKAAWVLYILQFTWIHPLIRWCSYPAIMNSNMNIVRGASDQPTEESAMTVNDWVTTGEVWMAILVVFLSFCLFVGHWPIDHPMQWSCLRITLIKFLTAHNSLHTIWAMAGLRY